MKSVDDWIAEVKRKMVARSRKDYGPMVGGYGLEERVRRKGTRHTGTVVAFAPTFIPTFLTVMLDNGYIEQWHPTSVEPCLEFYE